MFTGIIKNVGVVRSTQSVRGGMRITIDVDVLAKELSHGASLAVEGACLTVAEIQDRLVSFDVIAETLRRTTLQTFRPGRKVNLEPSLRVGDTIDGHFVQGHVDGTAELIRLDRAGGEHILWFAPQEEILKYLVPKGSVAIAGVSMTIAEVRDGNFSVAVIPTTLALTTLADLRTGDRVNIETDILSRTVVHHLESTGASGSLTLESLRSRGFA